MKYWDTVWDKKDIEQYRQYIKGYENVKNVMVREFQKHNCRIVCDAACGFGANSLLLQSNGFDVWGFDISETSVWITKELLAPYGIQKERFKTASLSNTGYPDGFFDAVAVRAAMDHLCVDDFNSALGELQRITKANGLLYVSFDPLEPDDMELEHSILEDGSFYILMRAEGDYCFTIIPMKISKKHFIVTKSLLWKQTDAVTGIWL